MQRITDPTAQADKHGPGKNGWTEGDPGLVDRTIARADWFDGVQEEILAPVEALGFTPSSANNQLLTAIQAMFHDMAMCSYQRIEDGNVAFLSGICFNSDSARQKWIAVGDTFAAASPDGYTWEAFPAAFAANVQKVILCDQLNLLLAVGSSGGIYTSPSSGIGAGWSTQTPASSYSGTFQAAAFNGTIAVIVGASGEIQTSTNLGTWTHRTAAGGYTGTWRAVTWASGLFVAVGDSGQIQTSPDGITWTARTPAASYSGHWGAVTYGNGLFVAAGASEEIQTSPNGITWTQTFTGGLALTASAAIYVNGEYIVLGSSGTAARSRLLRSRNGQTWRSLELYRSSVTVGTDTKQRIWHLATDGLNVVGVGNGLADVGAQYPFLQRSALILNP